MTAVRPVSVPMSPTRHQTSPAPSTASRSEAYSSEAGHYDRRTDASSESPADMSRRSGRLTALLSIRRRVPTDDNEARCSDPKRRRVPALVAGRDRHTKSA